jgi:hypothetical protein
MTKSPSIENAVTTMLGITLAIALWKPAWTWALWVFIALVFVGGALSLAVSTPADAARRRKGAWLIPVATIAIAAQMVYFAVPEERARTLLLGAALALSGVALFWARRRAT